MLDWDSVSTIKSSAPQGNANPWDAVSSLVDKRQAPIQKPKEPDNSDLFTRIGEDVSKRVKSARETTRRNIAGEQSDIGTNLSYAGNLGIGTGIDIISNIIGSSARGYGDLAKKVAPETSKDIASGFKDVANYVSDSVVGRGVKAVGKEASKLAKEYPVTADELGAVGNILAVPEVGGRVLQAGGKALTESGNAAEALLKKQAALDFIQPKQTSKVLEKAAKGPGVDFETGKSKFTAKDEDIANTVANVPGIDLKKGNIQNNLSAVNNEYINEANSLRDKLTQSKINFHQDEFQSKLKSFKDEVLNKPGLTSTERKATEKAIDEMIQVTNRPDKILTLPDILDARQKLDKTFLTKAGNLTSGAEKVYKEGLKPIRDIANNFIAEKLPDADVLKSLQKQHHLKTAIDNVATKVPATAKEAAKAPKGVMGKVAQHSKGLVGLAGGGVFLNELADLYPAIANQLAPAAPVLGGAYVIAKGSKKALTALKTPEVRKALGATLTKSGTLMRGGKPLTLDDITTEDLTKMTPEVRQLLLEAPEKPRGTPSAEKLSEKQRIIDTQNYSLPIRSEGPVEMKLLPAPDRADFNRVIGSGEPITSTAYPIEDKRNTIKKSKKRKK